MKHQRWAKNPQGGMPGGQVMTWRCPCALGLTRGLQGLVSAWCRADRMKTEIEETKGCGHTPEGPLETEQSLETGFL